MLVDGAKKIKKKYSHLNYQLGFLYLAPSKINSYPCLTMHFYLKPMNIFHSQNRLSMKIQRLRKKKRKPNN